MFRGNSVIRLRTYKHAQLPSVPKKTNESKSKHKKDGADEDIALEEDAYGFEQRPYGDNKYYQKKTDWDQMAKSLQELMNDGLIPGIDK